MLSLSVQTLTIDSHLGAPELSLLEDTTDVVRTVVLSNLGLVYTSILPLAALWIHNQVSRIWVLFLNYTILLVKIRSHELGKPPINIACKSVSREKKEDMIQTYSINFKRVTILITTVSQTTMFLSYFHLKAN